MPYVIRADGQRASAEDRFWMKVEKHDGDCPCCSGCWLWTAALNGSGYGSLGVHGKVWTAHRFAYVTLVGAIAEGLVVDHICYNRACVNPAHLEAVTPQQNSQRMALRNAPCCPRGHAYDEENTYWYDGHRQCKTCRKQHFRKWYDGHREEEAAKARKRRADAAARRKQAA